MFSKLFLILFLVISPIWPLGENPLKGDPYIIINKTTNELAFLVNGKVNKVYKIATGKSELDTPEGEFNIAIKAINPYYRRKNIVGGAKENPLGTRWIGFDALETDGRIYGVHGTNDRSSIGNYLTGGCVRMFNEEVEQLFNKVPIGTKIFITKTNLNFKEIGKEKGAIE